MAIYYYAPTGLGNDTDWSVTGGGGSAVTAVATNNGDTSYISSSTDTDRHEFVWPAYPVVPADHTVMAIRLIATAKVSSGGESGLKLSIRRASSATARVHELPRESTWELTEDYTDYAITFCNNPFEDIHSRDNEWTGSDVAALEMGVYCDGNVSGSTRVTRLRLEVIHRPETTLDAILSDDKAQTFQWCEIEGIRYVPTTRHLKEDDWTAGAYYYGYDYRPVAGSLSSNRMFRSGKINHAKGKEEIENAKITLLDVTQVAFEEDANGGRTPLVVKPQGFYSWLLAYGDRTNIVTTYMTDSTGVSWNTIVGLDPKEWSGSYGRSFGITTGTGSDFPTEDTDDSYCYTGKETIWYGTKAGNSIGDNTDTNALQRGCFGSMNNFHEWNHETGVYPQVSDHPINWNGRWVRWWINAIDPITGYPFPMSYAVARRYVWSSFSQQIAPNKNQYTVNLAPMEQLLTGKVPIIQRAPITGLSIRDALLSFRVKSLFAIGGVTPEYVISSLYIRDTYFRDINSLINHATTGINYHILAMGSTVGPFATGDFEAAVYLTGDTVAIQTKCDGYQVDIFVNEEMGALLGFGTTGQWIEPANKNTLSDPPAADEVQYYFGNNPVSEVSMHQGAYRIYVDNEDDVEGWATTYNPSVAIYLNLVVEEGDSKHFYVPWPMYGLTLQTDSNGKYFHVSSGPPAYFSLYKTSYEYGEKIIYSTRGKPAPTVRIALVMGSQLMHNFLLPLLLSTGFGHNYPSGYYNFDTLNRWYGLGIDERLVNWGTFAHYSVAMSMWRGYMVIDPIEPLKLLEEELIYPQGLILIQDKDGRLALSRQLIPITSDIVPDILHENWVRGSATNVSHSLTNIVNKYVVKLDYDPLEDKFLTTLIAREPNSIKKFGEKIVETEHHGLHSTLLGGKTNTTTVTTRSRFVNYCQVMFRRFGFEMATISGKINQKGLALLPGDGVRVTQDDIQDTRNREATGISNRACEVLKIDKDDVKGECNVELMYDGTSKKFGGYAPAGVISSWTGGTNTLTLHGHRISPATDPKTDAERFSSGDKVLLYEGNSSNPTYAAAEIESVDGYDITLTATVGAFTPADGDVIIWEGYNTLTAAQKAKDYVAVSDGDYVDSGDEVATWVYSV